MKKNIKKQSNRKPIASGKKKKVVLSKSKKVSSKKASLKKVAPKSKKLSQVKTKSLSKKVVKVTLQKKHKKIIRKKIVKNEFNSILTFGNIKPQNGKILVLIIAIISVASFLFVQSMTKVEAQKTDVMPIAKNTSENKNAILEKQINDLVAGYPIEKMTKYIAKQDPKVAAFLVAIAKKESAWGDRKPVLNGEDCYNYWGFRLKSDRMGSGGHTCFDSPEEAVEIVGARINHLVNEEKIDTPKEMVIWKCGYDCNGPESAGSQKWIKDVDYYYKQLIN